MKKCYFCDNDAQIKKEDNKPIFIVKCSECGNYKITDALKSAG